MYTYFELNVSQLILKRWRKAPKISAAEERGHTGVVTLNTGYSQFFFEEFSDFVLLFPKVAK
jgi:hypothetical protein